MFNFMEVQRVKVSVVGFGTKHLLKPGNASLYVVAGMSLKEHQQGV